MDADEKASPCLKHHHQRGRFGPGPNSIGAAHKILEPCRVPQPMLTDPNKVHPSTFVPGAAGDAMRAPQSPAITIARVSDDKWAQPQQCWSTGSSSGVGDPKLAPSYGAALEDPLVTSLKQNLWTHTSSSCSTGSEAPMEVISKGAELETRRPNSTSSIFATATVSRPDADQIVYCMASVLHVQLEHDANAPEELRNFFISLSDEHIRGRQQAHPTTKDIYAWINEIYSAAQMSAECNIIALVYINRALALSGMPLGPQNWRPVTLVALILAQKVWDDTSVRASCFSSICPEYSKDQIKRFEMAFLRNLEYSGVVTRELYTRYYFELRDLFEMANHGHVFPLEVLTQKRAEQLEIASSTLRLKAMKKKKKKRKKNEKNVAKTSADETASLGTASEESLTVRSFESRADSAASSQASNSTGRSSSNKSFHSISSGGASNFSTTSARTNSTLSSCSATNSMFSWSSSSSGRANSRNVPPGNPPRGRDPSQTMTWEDATMKFLGRYIQS